MREKVLQREGRQHYLAELGEKTRIGTRFDLVLEHDPFSKASIDDLDLVEQVVRDALPPDVRPQAQFYWLGAHGQRPRPADGDAAGPDADRGVGAGQRVRDPGPAAALVRGAALSAASVLFSYFATLGVSFVVFWLLDPHGFTGIDWKVAIFLFTILIAVGEDYNIFLIARIKQETAATVRSGALPVRWTGPGRSFPVAASSWPAPSLPCWRVP